MPPMRTRALRRVILVVIGIAGIAGCGDSRPKTAMPAAAAGSTAEPEAAPPAAALSELSPALAPLAWWLGDWEAEDGSSREHWVAAAGAVYGVSLHAKGGFEVMIVDDGEGPGKPDGVLRFIAMPGGERAVEFRQRTIADRSALFANEAHDFPKTIGYLAEGAGLHAVLGGDGKEVRFRFRRKAAPRAPELEAADLAFAADTAARGVDGWVAAFGTDGWMLRGGAKVQGAQIGEAMRPILTSGRLAWAPIASGRTETLGFTVGKATFTAEEPGDSWRSTYVTIWRKQLDGSWKVLFDTGRVVQG
jgi:hypothetical protein